MYAIMTGVICRHDAGLYISMYFPLLDVGVSLQEEPGLERGQGGHPASPPRSGLGGAAGHRGAGKTHFQTKGRHSSLS